MSNVEKDPPVRECRSEEPRAAGATGLSDGVSVCEGASGAVELLEAREVPLGGPRAMSVYRSLPQKARSLIGAWCFLDSYGPDDVAATGGMAVPRHPHTGLATVSWLFEGSVDHIDSAGNWATVRPGEVDLMNAGRGITHSEFSTEETTVLHGIQLWYAFPEEHRFVEPSLETYRPEPVEGPGWRALVFLGSALSSTSPVTTYIPLTGIELRLEPHTVLEIEVPAEHEHGLASVRGDLRIEDVPVPGRQIGYVGPGRTTLRISSGDEPGLALLLGGLPLNEQIVMWWNLVGRSHEEIERWRAAYQQEMGFEAPDEASPVPADRADRAPGQFLGARYEDGRPYPQFGTFPPRQPDPLPAPPLPNTRLRPRG